MNKGILMEVGKHHWIVMSSDGEFIKISPQEREARLGEEVHFKLEENKKPSFFQNFFPFARRYAWLSGGVVMVMLILTLLIPLLHPTELNAQSYIYIDVNTSAHPAVSVAEGKPLSDPSSRADINSSLEVGVDRNGDVISVRGVNHAGRKLIDKLGNDLDYEGANVGEFVTHMLITATEKELVNPKDGVIVSQVSGKGVETPEVEKEMKSRLNKIKENVAEEPQLKGAELEMVSLTLPDPVKKRAEHHMVSPTKYALWLYSRHEGHSVSIDDLNQKSVNQLLDILKGSFDPKNPPADGQWSKWMEDYDAKPENPSQPPADEEGDEQPPADSEDSSPGDSESPPNDGENTDGEAGGDDPTDTPGETEQPPEEEPPSEPGDEAGETGEDSSEQEESPENRHPDPR